MEERLLKKPKKRYTSWTEELNLDNLALLGPQWWVVRVSRVSGQETAERMARSLARNFPNVDFKVILVWDMGLVQSSYIFLHLSCKFLLAGIFVELT